MILRLPLRIKDSDKYRAEGAKPTLILKGTLQEFLIKNMGTDSISARIKL